MLEEEKPEKEKEAKKVTKEGILTGLRVLFSYIGQYRRQIIILSVLGILSAIGNGIIPYIAGKFFDAISSASVWHILSYSVPLYISILVVWALIQLVTSLLDWRINIMSQYFSNTIWLDYLTNSFSYLLLLPMSFHKQNKIGEIGSKINAAAGSLETIAGSIVIDLAPQILSIVIALCIAFYMKWVLGLILVVGLLAYIVVLVRHIRPLAGYQKAYYDVLMKSIWGDSYDVIGNASGRQASHDRRVRAREDGTGIEESHTALDAHDPGLGRLEPLPAFDHPHNPGAHLPPFGRLYPRGEHEPG